MVSQTARKVNFLNRLQSILGGGGHSWYKFTLGYDCTDVAMKNMLTNCVTKISTGHQPY